MPDRSKDYFAELHRAALIDAATVIWLEYYTTTERYDRSVCTGPMGLDGILPANESEEKLQRMHTLECLDKLRREATRLQIDPESLRTGRQRVVGMTLEAMERLLGEMRRGVD